VEPVEGVDSIVEHVLIDNPDFSDVEVLTKQIDKEALKFIRDIENFFTKTAA
jgi:hypothetical protein